MGFLSAASVALLAGCGVNRATLTREELECRRVEYDLGALRQRKDMNERVVRRWKREWDEYHAGQSAQGQTGQGQTTPGQTAGPPVFDVLIISGGGDKGAFAAGFLAGWGVLPTDEPLARPEFDIVTGVSTGALIAPFAFAGDQLSNQRIVELYEQPKQDWLRVNGPLFFLPFNDAFFNSAGLRRDVEREVNQDIVTAIARGSLQDRILAVGTTNLDLGLSAAWDLGVEAERVAVGMTSPRRIHDILLASAAVPAIFPPVVIDDALHVDGGTTSNVLVLGDLRSPESPRYLFRERYPDLPLPKFRYWVIVNNRLDPEPKIIQPSWFSITEASLDTVIRASTLTTLRLFAQELDYIRVTEKMDIEFRYVSIPAQTQLPSGKAFDRDTMQKLASIGMDLALSGNSWQSDSNIQGNSKTGPK